MINLGAELKELGKELLIAFVDFWVSLLKDFHSFRNKLILVSTILCICVIYGSKSEGAIISALGIWNMIIAYYFKKRNESAEKSNN